MMLGLDNPVLKWSLPDNSHVCLVSDSAEDASHCDRSVIYLNKARCPPPSVLL